MINHFVSGRTSAASVGAAGEADFASLLLDPRGIVTYCSPAAEAMFGYAANRLQGAHISQVLPEFSNTEVMPEGRLNPRVAFLCHCGRRFRAQRQDGAGFDCELCFSLATLRGTNGLRLLVRDVSQASQMAAAG